MAEKTIVVVDASALIGLAKIKKLKLLQELFLLCHFDFCILHFAFESMRRKRNDRDRDSKNWRLCMSLRY